LPEQLRKNGLEYKNLSFGVGHIFPTRFSTSRFLLLSEAKSYAVQKRCIYIYSPSSLGTLLVHKITTMW
jgi:hypothetical protein